MPCGSLETIAADLDFPALCNALDPEFVLGCLRDARTLTDPHAALTSVEVLNHKPGKRCTVRFEVQCHNGGFEFIGKWYHNPDRAKSMHALLTTLEAAQIRLPHTIHVSDAGVFFQHFIRGQELRHIVASADPKPFAEAGLWLAGLHALPPLPGLKEKPLVHELAKIAAWEKEIAGLAPEFAGALTKTARALENQAAHIGRVPCAPIHRDCSPANLLWDGERLWGIDFDQMATGDPAMDVGSFLAQLEKIAIRDDLPREVFERKAAAFLDAYCALGVDLGVRLPFFTSYTFLRVASAEVQRQRPRWRELAKAFLDRAHEEASLRQRDPSRRSAGLAESVDTRKPALSARTRHALKAAASEL